MFLKIAALKKSTKQDLYVEITLRKAATPLEKPILETSLNAYFCTIIKYKLKYQLIFLLSQYHNLDQDKY